MCQAGRCWGIGLGWLMKCISQHGGAPDGRQSRWAVEQKIEANSPVYIIHDMLGYAMELMVCWDQIDVSGVEVLSRLYQLLEESAGSMKVESLEHGIGRDKTSVRKGIALAPTLAKTATESLAQDTEIIVLKQRRKAREELAKASHRCKASLGGATVVEAGCSVVGP
eukprot:2532530-Amphidinium_carterae.1